MTSYFVVTSVILLNVAKAIGSQDFALNLYPRTVRGLKLENHNFTIKLDHIAETSKALPHDYEAQRGLSNVYIDVPSTFFEFQNVSMDDEGDMFIMLMYGDNQTVTFHPSIIGIYEIRFFMKNDKREYLHAEGTNEEATVRTIISRDQTFIRKSNYLFACLLLFGLFLMGLEIDIHIIMSALKRPTGPTIGFVSQFVFMPLIAYGLGRLILTNDYEKLGLIMLGSSPGGSASNFWTSMLNGDVNLSVTMTFVSSASSFGMTAFWLFVLGHQYTDKDIEMPYIPIGISLVTFVIPLALGTMFKFKWSNTASTLRKKISKPFFITCIIVMPVIGLLNNLYYFYLATWRHLLAGFCTGTLGYLIGATLAKLCRQDWPQIIAIAVETGIQNGGITLVILSLNFPSPYNELGLLPVFSYFFCSAGPILFLLYLPYKMYRYIVGTGKFRCVNKERVEEIDMEEVSEKMIHESTEPNI